MASLAVTFPQSKRTEVELVVQEMAARIRLIRGARVVLATEGAGDNALIDEPSERRQKTTGRSKPASQLDVTIRPGVLKE